MITLHDIAVIVGVIVGFSIFAGWLIEMGERQAKKERELRSKYDKERDTIR